jgi:hypothetical protein
MYSLVFGEDGKLSAVWVASDHQRSKSLLEVPLATVIEVFQRVGNDEVGSARYTFDAKKSDYQVENLPPDKGGLGVTG